MEQAIKERLTPHVVTELARRYGVRFESLKLLGSWQNFVYRFEQDGKGRILRLTHQSHRTPAMLLSELDFVQYLAGSGVSVARPVASPSGVLAEVSGEFTAVLFEEAPGTRDDGHLDQRVVLRRLGQLTGQMHRLARAYRRPAAVVPRFEWHQNDYLRDVVTYVPLDQTGVHAAVQRVIRQLHSLPRDEASYGLIHGDIVRGNYHWQGDRLTIFDFDEAQYAWYANDIGIFLLYCVAYPDEANPPFLKLFMAEFMEAYSREFNLDGFWLKQIPLFMRLRQVILYTAIYRSANRTNLHPWTQSFLTFARQNMERDEPPVDFDFA